MSAPCAKSFSLLPGSLTSHHESGSVLEAGMRLLRPETMPKVGKLQESTSMGLRARRLLLIFVLQLFLA